MLFTSFSFLLFFPLACILYYLIPYRFRWMYLLVVSYYFYINWQPIYALLLLASTAITYLCGRIVGNQENSRKIKKWALLVGCIIPLGFLFFFKYYDFLNGAVFAALDNAGLRWPLPELKLLLPIGISFYTFMAIGYLVDVYRGNVVAERNVGVYALFVAFFPQVASGPIGRAASLIPQLKYPEPLLHANVMEGLRQMMWGYFMKLCVADRLAIYVDTVYANAEHHNGTTLLVTSLLYTIQIYCDFAGYSLIAIGAARVMGIRLMENFRRPYFAKDIREFWSRWHISLSTWFRDYVYISLGGSRVSRSRRMGNLMVTFLVSGLWHGASWTLIIWGALHGALQILESLWKSYITPHVNLHIPSAGRILVTMIAINITFIVFRAPDITTAGAIIGKICTSYGLPFTNFSVFFMGGLSILILFVKDVADEYNIGFNLLRSNNFFVSHLSLALLCCYIVLFGVLDGGQFIYFQF